MEREIGRWAGQEACTFQTLQSHPSDGDSRTVSF